MPTFQSGSASSIKQAITDTTLHIMCVCLCMLADGISIRKHVQALGVLLRRMQVRYTLHDSVFSILYTLSRNRIREMLLYLHK
jgi:hypothetical protein